MKTSNLSTKLMMVAIVLTALVYFGASLASFFTDPFSTTVAYTYTEDHSVTVTGYVVREEKVLDESGDLVYYSRREGERVSKGGSVALLYNSAEALRTANDLRNLEQRMEQLLYARSLAGSIQSTVSLDDEVGDALTGFHAARSSGSIRTVTDASRAVRAAVLRYNYAYTGTDELDRAIASLQREIEELSGRVGGAVTNVRAPRSGLFSSLVDGYEEVLTPESLESMTPGDFLSLKPYAANSVGKMVYGLKWYFVALMPAENAEELTSGDRVGLRFQSGLDRDLTLYVERVSGAEDGQCLVVLSSDENLGLTTLLRHQTAQIVFESYSGLRVPRSAVRIVWETVLDETGQPVRNADGSEKRRQVYGVYCLWGNTARFKRVNILWQEDEFMIVESAQQGDTMRCLRPGDQVITAAEDLYDGKVIE